MQFGGLLFAPGREVFTFEPLVIWWVPAFSTDSVEKIKKQPLSRKFNWEMAKRPDAN